MYIKYSIIITFYQNVNMLLVCLQNLLLSLKDNHEVEVIIINDNPSISLEACLNGFDKDAPILLANNTFNMGYSAACNKGAAFSKGSYLIFLDCDIVVTPNWLTELENTMTLSENCGAVASTILDMANNQIVYAGMFLYCADTIKPFQGGYLENPYILNDHMCEILTSGCMMLSKEKFNSVGGFDEKLYNSCCDLDLSMKLNTHSWHNYISSKSIVYHRGNVSGEIRFASHTQARTHFFMTWGNTQNQERGIEALRTLYEYASVEEGEYLVIDMSASLYSTNYIDCFMELHHISKIDVYKLHVSALSHSIFLSDYLSWDICSLRIPILYFTDDYRNILGNRLWFQNRANHHDFIVDKNGNVHKIYSPFVRP